MKEKKWVVTKREHKSLKDGVLTVITEEPERKGFLSKAGLDNAIKIVSAASIFIPLVLLYLQYNYSITKKRNDDLSKILVNVSLDIESIKHGQPGTKRYTEAEENLLYKYRPQIATFKIDSLNKYFNKVSQAVLYHKLLSSYTDHLGTISHLCNLAYGDVFFDYYTDSKLSIRVVGSKSSKAQQLDSIIVLMSNAESFPDFWMVKYKTGKKSDSLHEVLSRAVSQNLIVTNDLVHNAFILREYLMYGNDDDFKQLDKARNTDQTNRQSIGMAYFQFFRGKNILLSDLDYHRNVFEQKTLSFIHN